MLDLAITGGTLVIPEQGIFRADVGIAGERVAMVAAPGTLPEAARTVDASGLHVLPGIIDPHAHFGSHTDFERDVEHETRAALAGGVTTIGVFVRTTDSYHQQFESVRETAERHSSTDLFFHFVVSTEQHLAELPSYRERYGVPSFKAYMAGIKNVLSSVDDDYLLRLFRRAAEMGPEVTVCIHAENEEMVNRAVERLGAREGPVTLADWARAKSDVAEEEGIVRSTYLAGVAGARIYIVHLSCARGAERIRALKARQRGLFAEAITHNLALTADHPLGPLVKRSPPLRFEEDVEALWRAVADGTVDALGTDNVVGSREINHPEAGILGAKVGFTALGTHLVVALHEGYHRRGIDLRRLVETMSVAPARIFGLYPRKGTILAGSDADLVLVDLNEERVVDHRKLHTWSDFSPWEGESLRGWPVATILRGRVAVERNSLQVEPGAGRYLARWPAGSAAADSPGAP